MPEKNPKVRLGLINLAMLPSYFDDIFVHLRQKVRLRPELSPKFLSTLGPNAARTPLEKPGPTYNSTLPLQQHRKSYSLEVKDKKLKAGNRAVQLSERRINVTDDQLITLYSIQSGF